MSKFADTYGLTIEGIDRAFDRYRASDSYRHKTYGRRTTRYGYGGTRRRYGRSGYGGTRRRYNRRRYEKRKPGQLYIRRGRYGWRRKYPYGNR